MKPHQILFWTPPLLSSSSPLQLLLSYFHMPPPAIIFTSVTSAVVIAPTTPTLELAPATYTHFFTTTPAASVLIKGSDDIFYDWNLEWYHEELPMQANSWDILGSDFEDLTNLNKPKQQVEKQQQAFTLS